MSAPANLDGSPDKEQALHKSEFEGMSVLDMQALTDAVVAWLETLEDF